MVSGSAATMAAELDSRSSAFSPGWVRSQSSRRCMADWLRA